MKTELCEKILELRNQGFTYSQIQKEIGCSKSLISYYLGAGQKKKNQNRQNERRKINKEKLELVRQFDKNLSISSQDYNEIDKLKRDAIKWVIYHKLYDFRERAYKTNLGLKIKKDKELIKIISEKSATFKSKKEKTYMKDISTQDVIEMIGDNPKCYLTGRPIDLLDSKSYHFDHKIPSSKGGKNTLDNLGICIKDANCSKTYLTVDEYVQLCKEVLTNFGYMVELKDSSL